MINSEQISAFLDFLKDCGQRCRMAEADEREANDETQDILHALELNAISYHEKARLATDLAGVRKRRRTARDTATVCQPIVEWAENNQSSIKNIERLLGDVRKAERSTQNRMYTPKVRTDPLLRKD